MSKNKAEHVPVEWSHLVNADHVDSKPMALEIAPDEDERRALAVRFAIDGLNSLSASGELSQRNMAVHVRGRFKATITQSCVVTLDPIVTEIDEEFEGWFSDADQVASIAKARREKALKNGHGELPILEENEDPEPIIDGKIDVGELVSQHLSLAINPYPQSEGADYPHKDDGTVDEEADLRKNPFAALKDWKDKL